MNRSVVSDLKTFAHIGCKIAAVKKVFIYFILFLHLFAPTSQSPMSILFFSFSESLGKSNGKKWSQIWKLYLIKSVKSPLKKCFFLLQILPYKQDFIWYWCHYPHRSRDALSPICGIFSIMCPTLICLKLHIHLSPSNHCFSQGHHGHLDLDPTWFQWPWMLTV